MFRVQQSRYNIQSTVGKSFGGASDAHDLVRAPVLLRPVPKQKIRQQLLEQRIRADGRHPLRKSGPFTWCPLVLKSPEPQPLSDVEEAGPVGAAVPRVSAAGAQEPGSSCAEEPGACAAEEHLAGKKRPIDRVSSSTAGDADFPAKSRLRATTKRVAQPNKTATLAPFRSPLRAAANSAASILLEQLEDVSQPDLVETRREAPNGGYYTEDEFLGYYGTDRGTDEWDGAPICDEHDWVVDPVRRIGTMLWPRERPRGTVVLSNGTVAVEVSTFRDDNVTVDILAALLRVRQAEFASQGGGVGTGVGEPRDPDAWDTSVAEPGVEIDIHRTLTEAEYERAWSRWRIQWQARIELTPCVQDMKENTDPSGFNKKMCANFAAYVKIWMGEPQVVNFIIQFGVGPPGDTYPMQQLIAAMRDSKDCGAEDPAGDCGRSRRRALQARRALCEGRQLECRAYCKLNERQMSLCDNYINGTLAREVDEANREYSHAVARTHEYDFGPGQNMCQQGPKCDAIALAPSRQQEQPGAVDPGWSHWSLLEL